MDITERVTVMVITAGGEIDRLDFDVEIVVEGSGHGIRSTEAGDRSVTKLVHTALMARAAKLRRIQEEGA